MVLQISTIMQKWLRRASNQPLRAAGRGLELRGSAEKAEVLGGGLTPLVVEKSACGSKGCLPQAGHVSVM